MAKRPLLRGTLEKSAAALLLSVLLPAGFSGSPASAEGDSAQPAAPAVNSAAPLAGKNAGEASKPPSGETAAEAKPAKANPGAKPDDAGPKAEKAAAKPADAAAPSPPAASNEPKPADAAAPSSPAASNEPKPADAAAPSPPAASNEPKPTAKAADSAVPSSPAASNEIPAAKPADNKPAGIAAAPSKPAEGKEAAAGAKPKDLTPKPDTGESLAIKASNVNAVYRIQWLGTHIGDFKLRSSITNRQYALQANADVSVFFGAVSWQGVTTSRGLMTANGPVPQNYTFRYATSERREALEIRFQQRMVSDIIINPPAHPGSRNVPITAADLQNVVDPLSAVVLLSQARLSRHGGEACNKRLPIFDGKIRYDLVLSPKGTRTVGGTGRLRGTAYVCRVSYVPIAGHKQGRGDYATGNTGIEIWLVPVPEAGLIVPYYVHVPTPAGTASLVASRFDVETPGGRHALAD